MTGGGGGGSTGGTAGTGGTVSAPALPEERPRGPAARAKLDIAWSYPVHEPEATSTLGRSAAAPRRGPLEPAAAFAALAGDDPRPLLVLRECFVCNGTDDALLSAQADNERTKLLLRWFHCVKLPPDVMVDEAHPFHALFEEGPASPHLFVCDRDGGNLRPLESERSRTELHDALTEALVRCYDVRDPRKPLKALAKVLDDLDRLDERAGALEAELDQTIEEDGPDARKVKKLRRDLAELAEEREELEEAFAKASAIELRPLAPAPGAAGAGKSSDAGDAGTED